MRVDVQVAGRGFYFRMGEPDWDYGRMVIIQFVTVKKHRLWNGFALCYERMGFRRVGIELLDWQKGHKIGLRIQSPIQRINYGKF